MMEMLFGDLSTDKGRVTYTRRRLRGFYHDCKTNPMPPRSGEPVEVRVFIGIDTDVKSASVVYTTDGSDPRSIENAVSIPMKRIDCQFQSLEWSYTEVWSATIPPFPRGTLVQYVIVGELSGGRKVHSPYLVRNRSSKGETSSEENPQVYGYYLDDDAIAEWYQDAIIYEIVPDRFAPDPGKKFRNPKDLYDIFGGTINGITSQIDYLENLGINCIWMTPIFTSPTHHGYDATAYDQIEPRLGSWETFQQLVSQCRKHKIKLILDFAANHVSSSHPFFKDALKKKDSKYAAWFKFRDWPDHYESYYAVGSMPILNTDNPVVREYLILQAMQWLDHGADGFRLDHAHGLSHLFWSHFRHRIKEKYPDAIMIGEVVQSPDRIKSYAGKMDGCVDFKLAELMRGYFAGRKMRTADFAREVERHLLFSKDHMSNPSFLDNHDMNRILWLTKSDTKPLKLASMFQFTLPVPPMIYYGTEVGLSQRSEVGRLEESRLPMLWGDEQNKDLCEFYKQLIEFRKKADKFVVNDRKVILVDDEKSLLIYDLGKYVLLLNKGRNNQKFEHDALANTTLCLASDRQAALTGEKACSLPAVSGVILRKV